MKRRKRKRGDRPEQADAPKEVFLCHREPEHGPLTFFEQANAYACMKCDKWAKQRCPFPDCPDCSKLKTPPSKFLS